jgi:hypothetical protein
MIWSREWKSTKHIYLISKNVKEWDGYIATMKVNHVRLEDLEDDLLWLNNSKNGLYTPKLGYKMLCERGELGNQLRWFKLVWEFNYGGLNLFVENLVGLKDIWGGTLVDECMKWWCENGNLKSFRVLPLIIAWGIWLARNASLFEDMHIPTIQCASQGLNFLSCFKKTKIPKLPR